MSFSTLNQILQAEQVPLYTIAKSVGTPCYVYSRATFQNNWQRFHQAFNAYPHQINYAVKANSNLAVLNTLATLGSGFDIVSAGELQRVLQAGGDPKKIVFSGVGKTKTELSLALEKNIGCINVESEAELLRLNDIALSQKKVASIALRINPNVDPQSHPFISTGLEENKFGISQCEMQRIYQVAAELPGIKVEGIACHIGSQITSLEPFLKTLEKMLSFIQDLKEIGITLKHLNLGGGLGVRYKEEQIPTPEDYADQIIKILQKNTVAKDLTLHIEPGRAIAADAGVLLTRVEYIKDKGNDKDSGNGKRDSNNNHEYFAIVDAGMNDLLRPALYGAWQEISYVATDKEIDKDTKRNTDKDAEKNADKNTETLRKSEYLYDIVGPVCESADFFGHNRLLPELKSGDLLAIWMAGAYGFSMSSNYNSRTKAAEVMVDKDQFFVVRSRETLEDLFKNETLILG